MTVERQGQPNVQVERAGEPQVTVRQSAQPGVTTTGQGDPAARQDMAATAGAAGRFSGMRADELMDKTVHGSGGETIGDVEGVVVGRRNQSPAVVVGVGAFLGIGERQVVIPLDRVRLGPDGRLTAELTKESVGSMQAYSEAEYQMLDRGQQVGAATVNRGPTGRGRGAGGLPPPSPVLGQLQAATVSPVAVVSRRSVALPPRARRS